LRANEHIADPDTCEPQPDSLRGIHFSARSAPPRRRRTITARKAFGRATTPDGQYTRSIMPRSAPICNRLCQYRLPAGHRVEATSPGPPMLVDTHTCEKGSPAVLKIEGTPGPRDVDYSQGGSDRRGFRVDYSQFGSVRARTSRAVVQFRRGSRCPFHRCG
jgi:hypothetical protein